MAHGEFNVIYGPNNIGKTTQTRLLANAFINAGRQLLVVKYPIYQLEPTGPIINETLRMGNPRDLSESQLQSQFAQNRRDFQPVVGQLMDAGVNILAEDYTGTGIAWGLTRDVPLEVLEEYNAGLLIPHKAVLLDGERYSSGHEKGHRNEADTDEAWEKNRKIHQFLAERYGWITVNANQPIEKVHQDIRKIFEI